MTIETFASHTVASVSFYRPALDARAIDAEVEHGNEGAWLTVRVSLEEQETVAKRTWPLAEVTGEKALEMRLIESFGFRPAYAMLAARDIRLAF